MRKGLLLMVVLIFLSGCNQSTDQFDSEKVQISLLNSQTLGNTRTYLIKLKNSGNFTMKNTWMFLSYPKKITNGIVGNPFKVEAKATSGNQNLIKPGEEVLFNITAPVGDFFSDTTLLDIDHPSIEFRGYSTYDNNEIPFGMGGNSLISGKEKKSE
jgi:hypothetical protein